MQEIVASVSNIKFDIETALELQIGAKPLPFPGMDKSGAAICTFHQRGQCSHGGMCPFRHVRGDRSIVCKHWLRGLCKKGDDCEFLHEFDMSKMPECYFYSKFGECANRECPFLHIDPESKRKDCPWYDRGFCRHGPSCKNRHVRRVLCVNYLCGFCLDGPACKFIHPKFELPTGDGTTLPMKKPICHHCGEVGHVIWRCFKISEEERANMQRQHQDQVAQMNEQKQQRQHGGGGSSGSGGAAASGPPMQGGAGAHQQSGGGGGGMAGQPLNKPMYRSLDEVTCFKCGGRGHYANKCPKGHLAFLSSSSQHQQQQPPASQQPPPSMAPRMQTS